jgi:hypothetical protein
LCVGCRNSTREEVSWSHKNMLMTLKGQEMQVLRIDTQGSSLTLCMHGPTYTLNSTHSSVTNTKITSRPLMSYRLLLRTFRLSSTCFVRLSSRRSADCTAGPMDGNMHEGLTVFAHCKSISNRLPGKIPTTSYFIQMNKTGSVVSGSSFFPK